MQERVKDNLFIIAFLVVALLLWLAIVSPQSVLDFWVSETTWLWATRLAQPATMLGTFLVIVQLVLLSNEQRRTTRAVLRVPQLLVGLAPFGTPDQDPAAVLEVRRSANPPNRIMFRLVTVNIGERSARNVKWRVEVPPMLWAFEGEPEARMEAIPGRTRVGIDNLDVLHPTERRHPYLLMDIQPDTTTLSIRVRVSMDDAAPSEWSLTVRVLPPPAWELELL